MTNIQKPKRMTKMPKKMRPPARQSERPRVIYVLSVAAAALGSHDRDRGHAVVERQEAPGAAPDLEVCHLRHCATSETTDRELMIRSSLPRRRISWFTSHCGESTGKSSR